MSKSVASEYNDSRQSGYMSGKRGSEDERNEDEESISEVSAAENLPASTTVSTAPTVTDQFTFTPEFRRHFIDFVPGNTLMRLRLATKGWNATADVFIDEGMRNGEIIVHDGKDVAWFSS
ncbi:hypothetical protein TrLO_g13685 [Triparma laevis f. longispina]|uniref:Uncharacterized protein n=1 Tax=Triparma laevis f. longispina TaxID=1714387 RepID=A0A9W6ZR94_9STRA|nr:hypothetical protein TrLO_g13685 [Triparma laevis f. longispina]